MVMVTEFISQILNLVNSTSTYNFVKNPIPVCFLLYAKKSGFCLAFDAVSHSVNIIGLNQSNECTKKLITLFYEKSVWDIQENFHLFQSIWDSISAYDSFFEQYPQIINELTEEYAVSANVLFLSHNVASLVETCLTSFYNHYYSSSEEDEREKSSEWVNSYNFIDCTEYAQSQIDAINALTTLYMDAEDLELHDQYFQIWKSGYSIPHVQNGNDVQTLFMNMVKDAYKNVPKTIKTFGEAGIFCVPKRVCYTDEFKANLAKWNEDRMLNFSLSLPSLNESGTDYVFFGISTKESNQEMVPFFFGEKALDANGKLDWDLLKNNISIYNHFSENEDGEELAPYFRPDLALFNNNPWMVTEKDRILDSYFTEEFVKDKSLVKLEDIFEVADENGRFSFNSITPYHFTNDMIRLQQEYKPISYYLTGEVKNYKGTAVILTIQQSQVQLCKWNSEESFTTNAKDLVLRLKKNSPVSLDYAAQALLNHNNLLCSIGYNISEYGTGDIWQNFLKGQIYIDLDKNRQGAIVSNLQRKYSEERQKELKAEMKRLGVRTASSDLLHMLSLTLQKMESSLYLLKNGQLSDEMREEVIALDENFKYMRRFFSIAGADIMEVPMEFKEVSINELICSIIKSSLNLASTGIFNLMYEAGIGNDVKCKICDDYFRIMFDTLLDNAYRHGFNKKISEMNRVFITSELVTMDNKEYVLLKVANNGNPLAEDFTLRKFISRGEYCGETGRTGLGGNHIYSILKKHGGFLNVTHNEEWNCIVEMLIPVESQKNVELKQMKKYEHYAECL